MNSAHEFNRIHIEAIKVDVLFANESSRIETRTLDGVFLRVTSHDDVMNDNMATIIWSAVMSVRGFRLKYSF